MAGEFGAFINEKRKGRGPGGQDIMLKDIATALGVTPTYLSDIVKGRRNPPDIEILNKLAVILQLTKEEREYMYDLAGQERREAAPDLPEYLMDKDIPHVRAALRRASDKKLGDEFWKRVMEQIEQEGSNE